MTELLPEDLSTYYRRLFPAHLMSHWLAYRSPAYFASREFSMTLRDDVYVRFLSFNDEAEFRAALLDRRPEKIDIGAVYTCRPRDRATVSAGAFQAREKELVLDIDLTDYDSVRVCCSEARVCAKCWLFMRIAVKVLDRSLRQDFGFRHLLWVYSGRRGIHCWVADRTARQLSASARSAVVEYLSLVRRPGDNRHLQQQQQQQQQQPPKCHPSVTAAADTIRRQFPDLVKQQDLFGTEERCRGLLDLLPEDMRAAAEPVVARWLHDPEAYPSLKRWMALSQFTVKSGRLAVEQELLIHYAYPRLDVHVTTGLNHLLKAPFCVHPKTGRVCVPFDPQSVDAFDPEAVPTLAQLLKELDAAAAATAASSAGGKSQQQQPHLIAYKSTSLRPAVEIFARFVDAVKADEAASAVARAGAGADTLRDATNSAAEIM